MTDPDREYTISLSRAELVDLFSLFDAARSQLASAERIGLRVVGPFTIKEIRATVTRFQETLRDQLDAQGWTRNGT